MKRQLSRLFHASLSKLGYWSRHVSALPRGIDYLVDIQRLATRFGLSIDTIFDVGAHTGQSIADFHRCWPSASIVSFEADPETYASLAAGSAGRLAQCFNLALGEKVGQVKLYRFGANATCNSLVKDNSFASHTGIEPIDAVSVPCDTVDNVSDRLGLRIVDLIKIDTEGHELEVLNGARATLSRRDVKFVYVEFNRITALDGRMSGALAPLAEKLEQCGFCFVASYPELSVEKGGYFSTSNALFFRSPNTP